MLRRVIWLSGVGRMLHGHLGGTLCTATEDPSVCSRKQEVEIFRVLLLLLLLEGGLLAMAVRALGTDAEAADVGPDSRWSALDGRDLDIAR